MLVLGRKVGESLRIGDEIVVTILPTRVGKDIRIGIDAPKNVLILREELIKKDDKKMSKRNFNR